MRFSVIVPIYQVEPYLRKCLESILAQSFCDYEIIAVNDGSPDNCQAIVEELFQKYPDRIRPFVKENGGLSDARNFGIERAEGEYLVFVDSDDSVTSDWLETLDREIQARHPDVIGYQLSLVDDEGKVYDRMSKPAFYALSGEEAIRELVEAKVCFDPACGFAFRRDYWTAQGFRFAKGIYHEDYALIPLAVLLASCVSCLDFAPYLYWCNPRGITKHRHPDRERKKAYDLLVGYDGMVSACRKARKHESYGGRLFLHYVCSALICRLESLEDPQLKRSFRKELKKRNVVGQVMNDNWKRKIRKTLIRIKNRL